MNVRFVDWIWRVRGAVPIKTANSTAETFAKMGSLWQEKGTSYRIDGDALTFTKKNPLPQDKMSVFDGGTLRIRDGLLHYDLMSRPLLACFLAPLLFLAVGQAGVAMDNWRNPPEVAKAKAEAEKRRSKIKAEDVPMNSIDKLLGAPKPEKKKGGEEIGKRNRKPSMTTAYVFMGIFFALWIFGRILEHRLFHARLKKQIASEVLLPFSGSGDKARPRSLGGVGAGP